MAKTKMPKNIQEAIEMGLTIHREPAVDKNLWTDRMATQFLNCTATTEGSRKTIPWSFT